MRQLYGGAAYRVRRRELLRHLAARDCELVREGGNHSWWRNRSTNKRSAVPRHQEVNDLLVDCEQIIQWKFFQNFKQDTLRFCKSTLGH